MIDQDMAGIFMVAVIVGVIVLAIVAIVDDGKHHDKFMAQCMQDHKQYECDALWRAGEDHTTVMPMPVIIGR